MDIPDLVQKGGLIDEDFDWKKNVLIRFKIMSIIVVSHGRRQGHCFPPQSGSATRSISRHAHQFPTEKPRDRAKRAVDSIPNHKSAIMRN